MPPLDPDALRAVFDAPQPFTVGLEEEVMLLDLHSFAPAPVAPEVVQCGDEGGMKLELPAAQVELVTEPHPTVDAAIAELARARVELSRASAGRAAPAAAAVHPAAPGPAVLNEGDRYRSIASAYGSIAARQLVGSLQVHVAVGSADRTLVVYNALRSRLPELAALAAAAPFHEGRDSGLASVRPIICGQLPRQGVPPAIESWEAFAADLSWGVRSGTVVEPTRWWWELRPHVVHGTLEVRVPDVQPTIDLARAVAAVVHALVRHLAARHEDGEPLAPAPSWRIAENRWSALRHGLVGAMADLETGEVSPTRARLHRLLDEVEPHAPSGLDRARAVVEEGASERLRRAGLEGAARWLTEVFLPD